MGKGNLPAEEQNMNIPFECEWTKKKKKKLDITIEINGCVKFIQFNTY